MITIGLVLERGILNRFFNNSDFRNSPTSPGMNVNEKPEMYIPKLLFDGIVMLEFLNSICQRANKINQPNAVRLALSCATGQEVKLLEKKMYFVDFEVGNASIGGSFLLKEIKTFNEETSIKFKTH